jgi:N-acetyl-anhydromuramyl-L-alanine amidase AmpD
MFSALYRVFLKLFPNLYLSEVSVDAKGWLQGPKVKKAPIDPSWAYKSLSTKQPAGLVWHYSATNPGTAMNMAKRRMEPYKKGVDRAASWHVSIEQDGTLVQMLPLTAGAWHCVGKNRTHLGFELIGHGKEYPEAQVVAARQLVQACVDAYGWLPQQCKLEHKDVDPKRRADCGEPWTSTVLPRLLSEIAWKRPSSK